ncbi:hypothetical protein MD484_g1120, partial [Candolleomyces efflorescens]
MASSEIQVLLAPPSSESAVQKAVNLLDTRFTSLDQLDELESAVLQAQSRYNDLQEKLNASQVFVDSYIAETRASAKSQLKAAQELSQSRHVLSDELSELSRDLVSVLSDEGGQPTLLEDLETLHRNLKELQSVKTYVQIVEHALNLSEGALKDVQSAVSITPESLQQYGSLLHFVNKAQAAASPVKDGNGQQTLHLISFLEHLRDKTWRDIKLILSTSLSSAAEQLGWPTAINYPACEPAHRQAFEKHFLNLLSLQLLGRKLHKRANFQPSEKDGLYAIDAMVLPISLRFKYHYDGNRQTNRLDKPEWYFTYILNIAHEHHHFMDTVVQHLLSRSEYKNISASVRPIPVNGWSPSDPPSSSALERILPIANSSTFSKVFDAAFVEEGIAIEKTSVGEDLNGAWEGISEVILGNPEWFNAWLHAEKKFVEDQYHEIVSSPDAWFVADEDEEEIVARDVRATNSARRIRALVNQVTDRFSPLPSANQRSQFLISVQLPLLDLYRARITSALDAFETVSYAFVRAVPGALSISLSGKDEGTFFLELWQDIIRDPELKKQAEACSLLPKTTSSSVHTEAARETVFEEMMSRYQKITTRAEDMTVQQICGEIEAGLRTHFVASTGISAGEPEDGIGISQTLLGPIALLSSHLSLLRQTLPLITFTTLYRRIAGRLSEHILQRQILYRGSFSRQEGATLHAECELWVETCHTALAGVLGGGRQRVEAPWTKLLQAGRLAGAIGSAWETITNATFGTAGEEDWEKAMLETTGLVEMTREDVSRLLRRRDDCP